MDSSHPYAFIAGTPALDFVDTYGSRAGVGRERLPDPAALVAWLNEAGLWAANAPRTASPAQLLAAHALREAIHRCALSAIASAPLAGDDLARLNDAARHPPPRPCFCGDQLVQLSASPVEAALSRLAEDALVLLASPRRARIRRCPGCAMVFEDTSRPGSRQWCSSSQGCGNRAKVRAHRARRTRDTATG